MQESRSRGRFFLVYIYGRLASVDLLNTHVSSSFKKNKDNLISFFFFLFRQSGSSERGRRRRKMKTFLPHETFSSLSFGCCFAWPRLVNDSWLYWSNPSRPVGRNPKQTRIESKGHAVGIWVEVQSHRPWPKRYRLLARLAARLAVRYGVDVTHLSLFLAAVIIIVIQLLSSLPIHCAPSSIPKKNRNSFQLFCNAFGPAPPPRSRETWMLAGFSSYPRVPCPNLSVLVPLQALVVARVLQVREG